MKLRFILSTLFLLFAVPVLHAQTFHPEYSDGRAYIRLRTGTSLPEYTGQPDWQGPEELQSLFAQYGVQSIRHTFRTRSEILDHTWLVRFSEIQRTGDLLRDLGQISFVEYAELSPLHRTDYIPNDLNLLQWHLFTIDAPLAWDRCRGSRNIVVAIVDDAVRMSHEELQGQLWTNTGEIDGNLTDDDLNGYVDDIHGYDVADDDNDPSPPIGANNWVFTHGTHVAGIAAASTDNGTGIASIGFNVSIMPVKTKHDTTIGSSTLDGTMEGVDYAIASHADVVNMSFGGGGATATWKALIDAGYFQGVLFIGAAGNDGMFVQEFPGSYENCVSVGSTNSADKKSGFSNYHYSVDVMAPGSEIFSCLAGGPSEYGYMSGTSMSTPLTAGLCALIKSADTTLSPDGIRACLEGGCENIDLLNPDYVGFMGYGRINAANSLACAAPIARDESLPEGTLVLAPYPNPATEQVHFNAKVPTGASVSLRISDVMGRDVYQTPETVSGGFFKAAWEIPHGTQPGLYFAVWNIGGKFFSAPFLVSR